MTKYIIAHDLGTSGNKATLFDLDGNLLCRVTCAYPTFYPKEGWVEQCPDDWWRAVCCSTKNLLEKSTASAKEVACVCFSGQMMGCLLVDADGTPLHNMMIWADTRSTEQELAMLREIDLQKGYQITGHRLSASYSAAKLLWIKDNEPGIYARAAKMLQAKDYIIMKLTGKAVTEFSDASGTNLLDIKKKEWSQELLDVFHINKNLLPDLYQSTDVAGGITASAAALCGLQEGTPVVIGGGDGSCACVGAGVVEEGKTYSVLGSSSWISTAKREPDFDPHMRTFNWIHLNPDLYTPCGTMQSAGYSVSWYRDVFGNQEAEKAKKEGVNVYHLLDAQVEKSPPGANGVMFLPYLLGERSPHWNHTARGAFVGMGISTKKSDIVRSVLEGVGFNLRSILEILEQGMDIQEITVIGGGAKGDVWIQILSDIWEKPLAVPSNVEEATSMGAAICGGIGVGIFQDFLVADNFNKAAKYFKPQTKNKKVYQEMYSTFCKTYERLVPTYHELYYIPKI